MPLRILWIWCYTFKFDSKKTEFVQLLLGGRNDALEHLIEDTKKKIAELQDTIANSQNDDDEEESEIDPYKTIGSYFRLVYIITQCGKDFTWNQF